MDRAAAVELLSAVGAVENLLDDCPHGTAKKIKEKLAAIEGIADGVFPGGYAGECIDCDKPVGNEEVFRIGDDEACCPSCWEKRVDRMHSCQHEFQDDTDEHGDAIKVCHKCGCGTLAEAAA